MHRFLFFSILIFFPTYISAQFGIENIITASETSGASGVYAADFDGDNFLDVVCSSNRDSKISWYRNNGADGTFGPQQIISDVASSGMKTWMVQEHLAKQSLFQVK